MPRYDFNEITDLGKLKELMVAHKAVKLFVKKLSPNDNSKNQVYLGSNFEALNIIPNKGVYVDSGRQGSKRDRFKADVDFKWVDATATLHTAPDSQLILYPKYPEVRMSGFLKGCKGGPSSLMQSRKEGRLLFLGITNEGKIISHLTGPENPVRRQVEALTTLEATGVFLRIPLESSEAADSRNDLIMSLRTIHLAGWMNSVRLSSDGRVMPCKATNFRTIHLAGWMNSVRLSSDGRVMPCKATNCGGYTLEAKLGITPNGWSEPDYMGWEIKQHGVTSFERPHSGSPITLMTPEPTAGIYKEKGVEFFIRKFGYPDKKGRENRLNFGGIHRHGSPPPSTGLILCLNGFNSTTGKINNLDGGISLVSSKGEEAATWLFADMMKHWNRKHAKAAYIPSLKRTDPRMQYKYGNFVELGVGTDFLKFLKAMARGQIYYDPGIKLEDASSSKPKIKRRSQFRIKTADLKSLYETMEVTDLLAE